MLPFAQNVSFYAIDLKDSDYYRPGLLCELKDSVIKLLFGGKVNPVQPLHVYGISEVEDAFQYLQSGINTVKTVIEMRPNDVVNTVLDVTPLRFLQESATYLIAGGLGGIGRSVARWMVRRGAKHLILLSRYGPTTEAAHSLLQELQSQGIEVKVPAVDIADKDALRDSLSRLTEKMPPIRGCIQSAMELQDCPFELMPHEKWTVALAPKVRGTYNLHTLLPRAVDFFVMFSSITGVMGSPAQANYSAGCAYQDALARHRVGAGEKATTINLGVMLDDGVLTENPSLMQTLQRTGYFIGISRRELYALLDYHCDPSREITTPLKTQVIVGIDVPSSLEANSISIPDFMRRPPFRHLYNMGPSNNIAKGYNNDNTKETDKAFITNLSSITKQEEAAALISNALSMRISKVLAVPFENLDSSKAMHIYGVDSLVAVELRNWFAQTLGADLAMFEILGNATFDDIGTLVAARSRMAQHFLSKNSSVKA